MYPQYCLNSNDYRMINHYVVYFCTVFSYLLPIGLHRDVNLHDVIINQGRWDATKNGLWPNCTLPRINKILKKKKKEVLVAGILPRGVSLMDVYA